MCGLLRVNRRDIAFLRTSKTSCHTYSYQHRVASQRKTSILLLGISRYAQTLPEAQLKRKERADSADEQGISEGNCVAGCELIRKRSLWQYRGDDWVPFIKIITTGPRNVPKIRDESSFHYFKHMEGLIMLCFYVFSRKERLGMRICSLGKCRRMRATCRIFCGL